MPRKLTCAQCGKPMMSGGGSLPQGQATCRDCRRERRKPDARIRKDGKLRGSGPQTWTCQSCGDQWTRPSVRGQVPKWCPTCRTNPRTDDRTCPTCGGAVAKRATYCSQQCCGQARVQAKQLAMPLVFDQRSRLRRGIEDGNSADVIAALRQRSAVDTDTGCWVWTRRIKDGYPIVVVGNRTHAAHRLALEARIGAKLGSQAAHHICANTACVNPTHLQPVTHRENVAEMLARRAYQTRIRELEDALREAAPGHPLLRLVQIA